MLNNRRKSQKNASNIIFIYIFAPEKQAKRVNAEIAVRRWRTSLRRVRNANVRLFLLTRKKRKQVLDIFKKLKKNGKYEE